MQFDDFKVTYTPTNVIQYSEYYPFGLQTSNSWTREDASNNYLYNAGSELNNNTGWYETFFRGYDATLGRFNQVDPMAYASSLTPYNYAFNDPVSYNDPAGAYPEKWMREMSRPYTEVPGGYWAGGGGGSIMPGSGNHWSDQYRSKYGDYFLMSSSEFEAKWNQSVSDYRQESIIEQGREDGEVQTYVWCPYCGDFAYTDASGNSYYRGDFIPAAWDNGRGFQTGSPIVFVSFTNAPKSFDKSAYMSHLTSALVANGFNKSITVNEYSLSGKARAWWNNSPNVTISFTYYYQGLVRDAGGYSPFLGNPDNTASPIIYWGLDDASTMFEASISSYVNATLHEMGHAVFGFEGDTRGVSQSLMDYDYTYIPGQTFNAQELAIIRSSIWGNH